MRARGREEEKKRWEVVLRGSEVVFSTSEVNSTTSEVDGRKSDDSLKKH